MAKRNYTTKSGDVFEWEETPETVEALKALHRQVAETKQKLDTPSDCYNMRVVERPPTKGQ